MPSVRKHCVVTLVSAGKQTVRYYHTAITLLLKPHDFEFYNNFIDHNSATSVTSLKKHQAITWFQSKCNGSSPWTVPPSDPPPVGLLQDLPSSLHRYFDHGMHTHPWMSTSAVAQTPVVRKEAGCPHFRHGHHLRRSLNHSPADPA